jgi:regulator of protease activity HflC (stomatin/prohibitin superfamily)
MKKGIIVAALMLSACGYAAPDAGEQAVLVRKPWFFGTGGVDPVPVSTGSKIVASSTDVVKVPVTPIAFDIPFDNLMPSNGIPLDFHTTVRMQITDAPELVAKWNGGAKNEKDEPANAWFWSNIAPVYSNFVRQDVKNYDMASLAFSGAAIDQIDQHVGAQLADFIRKNKMPIKLLSVTVGRAAPPQEILDQRTETAAQTQREQTMIAQQKAEQARKGAELARAEADNAYRAEMQLSPEQYVQLKAIEMQKSACTNGTSAQGIEAGTDETPTAAQPVGQEPGPKDAPTPNPLTPKDS